MDRLRTWRDRYGCIVVAVFFLFLFFVAVAPDNVLISLVKSILRFFLGN